MPLFYTVFFFFSKNVVQVSQGLKNPIPNLGFLCKYNPQTVNQRKKQQINEEEEIKCGKWELNRGDPAYLWKETLKKYGLNERYLWLLI